MTQPLKSRWLANAPALIEAVFPAQKVSFEAKKERKANLGQTLTGLGSSWKGCKPLILVRAIVLGSLLPQTDDAKKDLEIFEKLMAFDDESLARRALIQNAIKPKDFASLITLGNPCDFFSYTLKKADLTAEAVDAWAFPLDADYADDLLVPVKTIRAGARVKDSVTRFLTRELAQVVNEQKSRVVKTNECQFLGFTFRGSKLRWSDQAFEDFKHNVRRLTGRSWGGLMGYRLHKLAQYVRGWMGYFGISDYYRPIPELDPWLRRRIRMCYWKQWRRTRTKVRNLLALGTSKRHAILTALSSKSYWHLSRTLATQSGMTNEWMKSQGLIDIRTMWMKAHGYA